jgi:monofunctional biosynthetic peptidoglycan transglycosylase
MTMDHPAGRIAGVLRRRAGVLAACVLAGALCTGAGTEPLANERSKRMYDFEHNDQFRAWRSVDDRVMGGISASRFEPTGEGTALFTGEVSLERNGGFASVRSPAESWDLSGYDELVLRVRGDGKTYKLALKTDNNFDGILYQLPFQTRAGEWREVRIALHQLVPTYHGRYVPQAGPLEADRVSTIGFMISDKQAGPFRLEIDWIEARKGSRP